VYQTAVESMSGAAGLDRTAKVIGLVGDGTQPTVSFSVLWEKGKIHLSNHTFPQQYVTYLARGDRSM